MSPIKCSCERVEIKADTLLYKEKYSCSKQPSLCFLSLVKMDSFCLCIVCVHPVYMFCIALFLRLRCRALKCVVNGFFFASLLKGQGCAPL